MKNLFSYFFCKLYVNERRRFQQRKITHLESIEMFMIFLFGGFACTVLSSDCQISTRALKKHVHAIVFSGLDMEMHYYKYILINVEYIWEEKVVKCFLYNREKYVK